MKKLFFSTFSIFSLIIILAIVSQPENSIIQLYKLAILLLGFIFSSLSGLLLNNTKSLPRLIAVPPIVITLYVAILYLIFYMLNSKQYFSLFAADFIFYTLISYVIAFSNISSNKISAFIKYSIIFILIGIPISSYFRYNPSSYLQHDEQFLMSFVFYFFSFIIFSSITYFSIRNDNT